MKAISLIYQRNGIAGEGFFQFAYEAKEDGFIKPTKFIATFTTKKFDDNKEHINPASCRVTSIQNTLLKWRGDYIAGMIEQYLYQTFGDPNLVDGGDFYDLIDKVNPIHNS